MGTRKQCNVCGSRLVGGICLKCQFGRKKPAHPAPTNPLSGAYQNPFTPPEEEDDDPQFTSKTQWVISPIHGRVPLPIKMYPCMRCSAVDACIIPNDLCMMCATAAFRHMFAATGLPVFKQYAQLAQCQTCGDLTIVTPTQGVLKGSLKHLSCNCTGLFSVFQWEDTMTPVTNVRIWWDASILAYRMASPYNADLVESVKQHIPISDRSFDPVTKTWTIVERQLAPLRALLGMLGVQPSITTRQQAEQAAAGQSPKAKAAPIGDVAMQFLVLAGPEAMQRAFRHAAMQLHPDRQGGDASKMSTLNAAWDRLQRELYKVGQPTRGDGSAS